MIGGRIDEAAFFSRIVDQMAICGWNDIIIILYGLAAIPVGFFFLPTALRYPKVLEYFCIAFCFYIPHTILDAIVEPPTDLSRTMEKSLKLFSSTFLMIAMLVGLLGVMHSSTSSE